MLMGWSRQLGQVAGTVIEALSPTEKFPLITPGTPECELRHEVATIN